MPVKDVPVLQMLPPKTVTERQLGEALRRATIKAHEIYADECYGTVTISLRPDRIHVEVVSSNVFKT